MLDVFQSAPRAAPQWWPALRRRLTLTLVLKFLALWVLWLLFFSPAHRDRPDTAAMTQRLAVHTAPVAPASTAPASEETHP